MKQISDELLADTIEEIEEYEEILEKERGCGYSLEQLEERGLLPEVLLKLRELRDTEPVKEFGVISDKPLDLPPGITLTGSLPAEAEDVPYVYITSATVKFGVGNFPIEVAAQALSIAQWLAAQEKK